MKQLIINADDFGLHAAVNSGIITGFTQGIITSTSIMPNGRAYEDAVRLAFDNPRLGIGIHLTLVGEAPVLPPDKVPSLVNAQGYLPQQYPQFLLQYITGKIQLADIKKELYAQVQKVIACGLPVTHIDSHQHMHIVPGVIDITIDLAKEFNIPAVRIPAEPYFFRGGYPASLGRFIARGGLTFLAQIARNKILNAGLQTSQHFYGMLAGGNMQAEYLLNIIRSLPEGASEVMVHPGDNDEALYSQYQWNLHWQAELAATQNDIVKAALRDYAVKLISFRELVYDKSI